MPLERGVAPTGAAPPSQTPAKEQAVPPLKSFKELSPTRAERLNWSVLVLLTAIAALGVHEALNRDMIPMWRRVELQVQPNAHREPLLSVEALRHEHQAMPEVKDGQPQQRVEKQQQPVAEQRPQTEQQAQQPKTEAQLGARAEPAKFKVEQPHEPEQVEQAHEPEQVEQEEQATLEGQLMGCRTLKTDPIPAVDKSPSLRVLETYTPQQQQQAQQYTAAVGACTDFACLRQANQLPRAPGQFPFPHFLVIGFPKCATTSIYCHLIQHPQVQHPKLKEPHLLTDKCRPSLSNCSVEAQQQYVVEILNLEEAAQTNFTRAAFEGSTHYVQESDWLPEQLAAAFPWLKMAISMREPISQAIAMLLHNVQHGRALKYCTTANIFNCIRRELKARAHYSSKLRQWMAFFPREQLHVVQYEGITAVDAMPGALLHLKSFLGVDESLPSGTLPLTNWKHQRSGPDELGKYWMLRRADYELLVGMARNDTVEVLGLMMQHGLATNAEADDWLARWERVWQANLSSCGEEGSSTCKIVVS